MFVGVCVPKLCTVEELRRFWNYTEEKFKIPVGPDFDEELCLYKNTPMEVYEIDSWIL
jgi:hypothetical protein